MKITIVLGAFLPVPAVMGGAVEKIWFVLGREFARCGHEVTMISRKITSFPNEEVIERVRHVRVPGFETPSSLIWLKVLDFLYSLRVLRVLPEADIVVTNTFWLPLLIRAASAGAVYVHVARFPKWQMKLYRRAARLQAPSRAVSREILDSTPGLAGKVTVIPYPAPVALIPTDPPVIEQRPKIVLFVGRVHPEKGVHLLVRAFAAHARTLFADWKLMIVGPTELRFGGGGEEYGALLRQASGEAAGQVEFAGPIFDAMQLEEYFRAARLFVYPSLAEHGESFGLAALEAMTNGCAVVVSDLGCFHDFIRDGVTGFIFDHRQTKAEEELANKMQAIVSDEPLLETVSRAGVRKARDYSVEKVAGEFLKDFQSIRGGSHGGAS